MQFAKSDPSGPVYLTAAREVLEQEVKPKKIDPAYWPVIPPSPAPTEWINTLAQALDQARRPLVVTSYVGRKPEAVAELTRFCERCAIGVIESVPNTVNFPSEHPMYQGMQGNEPAQNAALAEADLVLVIDSDVPWIPTVNKPRDGVPIFHVDIDPIKEQMPLWYLPAAHIARADALLALQQMNAAMPGADYSERREYFTTRHAERQRNIALRECSGSAEWITSRIRQHLDENGIVLNEGITNYKAIGEHIGPRHPGGMFTSGGGSLGWNGGAAIGFKLAKPEKTIVALTGDGSYMFSVPSSVHWMARRYRTPFLQVVYNNGGWRSPRLSMLSLHPNGYASRSADIGTEFVDPPDYAGIAAAAGGAFARKVERPEDLDAALEDAFKAVREDQRAAVLDVIVGECGQSAT
jgi:acetolactate synthase-1/2/3 large subunit